MCIRQMHYFQNLFNFLAQYSIIISFDMERSTSDFISEISRNDLPRLRDLYLRDWPENIIGYYTINNYIRWLERDPNIKKLKFYCLNDDFSDGSYAIIVNIFSK